jgi:hypothetical protein
MTEYSGGYGKEWDGNSMLFQISKNKFMFVGTEIYSFKMEDEIKKFYSHVGNSACPYPYIVGKNNIYFMLEKFFVKKEFFKKDIGKDFYDEYYERFDNNNDKKEKFKDIKKY